MSRTPLFTALRRAIAMARIANRPGAPPVDELPGLIREWNLSRRTLLKAGAVGLLAAGGASTLAGCFGGSAKSVSTDSSLSTNPRVVIVGAGLAGLNAAYTLKKSGIVAQLFEASTRAGGRIYSRTGMLASDLTTELGGEFIDSGHEDLLALVGEFNLKLLDLESDAEKDFATMFYFEGQSYTMADVVEAFRPIASLLDMDKGALTQPITYDNPGEAKRLDHLSLSSYLSKLGVSGWLRALLETAYVTEFGLETSEQSALNLITLIGTDLKDARFDTFGESDERYKVDGGNDKVTQALAAALGGQISTGQTLESVRSNFGGYSLVFRTQNGTAKMVAADVLILALPFTKLREVDMQLEMPAIKKRAIAELGYGANAKVFLGFNDRIWRKSGYSGGIFTDQSYQMAWDNARGEASTSGGLTLFTGGKNAIAIGKGDVNTIATNYLAELAMVFGGIDTSFNGKADRFHWPTYPFSLASYSAYKPGQWTGIRGAEAMPVGNLYFAGEHCSLDYQGYMNGAAETGRKAAEAILERIRK